MTIPGEDLRLARQRGYLVCWVRDIGPMTKDWAIERYAKEKPVIIVRRDTAESATVIWVDKYFPMSYEQLTTRSIAMIAGALARGAHGCLVNPTNRSFAIGDVSLALALELARDLVEMASGPREEGYAA